MEILALRMGDHPMLPETPEIRAAKERALERGVDFDGAKHRAHAVIDFIDTRGMDNDEEIGGRHRLEEWQREAILEAFEIGPEAMFKEGARVDHVV
jgi:hypothetical protein